MKLSTARVSVSGLTFQTFSRISALDTMRPAFCTRSFRSMASRRVRRTVSPRALTSNVRKSTTASPTRAVSSPGPSPAPRAQSRRRMRPFTRASSTVSSNGLGR